MHHTLFHDSINDDWIPLISKYQANRKELVFQTQSSKVFALFNGILCKLNLPGLPNDSYAQEIIHVFLQPEFHIDIIIDNLKQATGYNLAENGTINIKSHSIDERYPNPKSLVNFCRNNCYVSQDDEKTDLC